MFFEGVWCQGSNRNHNRMLQYSIYVCRTVLTWTELNLAARMLRQGCDIYSVIIEINRLCTGLGNPNYTSYGGIRIVYRILGMRAVIRPIPPPELITPPELRVVIT